jgi:hypothetical protein
MRCDTESLFLLGFSDEEFLAALVMASSGAFFNKLLVALPDVCFWLDSTCPVWAFITEPLSQEVLYDGMNRPGHVIDNCGWHRPLIGSVNRENQTCVTATAASANALVDHRAILRA